MTSKGEFSISGINLKSNALSTLSTINRNFEYNVIHHCIYTLTDDLQGVCPGLVYAISQQTASKVFLNYDIMLGVDNKQT